MTGQRNALIGLTLATAIAGGLWVLTASIRPSVNAAVDQRPDPTSKLGDLLDRKLAVPFPRETPMVEVAAHLARELGIRVILDPAALARLDLRPEDPITLDLAGAVRLRTALPLLLDQLGLTYRFVAEDDLLILTDARGAGDPLGQVLDELRDLHRDVHDLQDAVEELYDVLEGTDLVPNSRKPWTLREPIPRPDPTEPREPGQLGS